MSSLVVTDGFYTKQVTFGNHTAITFNCPPEQLKRWFKEKLPLPHVVVIGDTPFVNEVPLVCPEFPFLTSLFTGGGFDVARQRIEKPFILVGDEKKIALHMKALRLALSGLTCSEYRSKNCRVSKSVREMMLRESVYFALKRNGTPIPFEEYVRPAPFKDNKAFIEGIGEIHHLGTDLYEFVSADGEQATIALKADKPAGPLWRIPSLRNIESPHTFRVLVLGSDNGFGAGPTTGYLIELNGEYILWDCPPYCTTTLSENGISLDQIRSIVVSHIHDDHANDLIKFALSPYHKVEIIATREVKFSILHKLSAMMNMPIDRIRHLFRWREIQVRSPFFINGYRFDFHYGVHPVPSIGTTISQDGKPLIVISGDTGFTKILDDMVVAGAIKPKRRKEILSLLDLPCPVLVDAGASFIHGEPDEYIASGRDLSKVYMYHRGELPDNLSQKVNLVKPGDLFAASDASKEVSYTALIGKVLRSLRVREAERWACVLMSKGREQYVDESSLIVQQGSDEKENFYIIAHGCVDVRINNQVVATLHKGNFFGEQALLTGNTRNADIWAVTPVRLIAIPQNIFIEMIREEKVLAEELGKGHVLDVLQKIWRNRLVISRVKAFASLPASHTYKLAIEVVEQEFPPGSYIVRQGSTTDQVYIIAQGKVEIVRNTPGVKNPLLGKNTLVGENVALGYTTEQNASVRAIEHTQVFVLSGDLFRTLVKEIPRLQYEMTRENGTG